MPTKTGKKATAKASSQGARGKKSVAAIAKTSKRPRKTGSAIKGKATKALRKKSALAAAIKDNKRALKRKRTGKEIAVIVISIIMVVSILLPSFAVLFGKTSANTTPTSFENATQIYEPLVQELQNKVTANPGSAQTVLDLANEQYRYGTYATQFAKTDDQKAQSKTLMKNAIASYTKYLNMKGALQTYDEKNAVVSRALCNLYIGDSETAINQLKDLLKETNFAPAWQSLGMIYESEGNTNQAIEAYQNALDAPQETQQDVRSYCEGRLNALKAQNAQTSGGAAALNQQLN